jgi:hypothetical protein
MIQIVKDKEEQKQTLLTLHRTSVKTKQKKNIFLFPFCMTKQIRNDDAILHLSSSKNDPAI